MALLDCRRCDHHAPSVPHAVNDRQPSPCREEGKAVAFRGNCQKRPAPITRRGMEKTGRNLVRSWKMLQNTHTGPRVYALYQRNVAFAWCYCCAPRHDGTQIFDIRVKTLVARWERMGGLCSILYRPETTHFRLIWGRAAAVGAVPRKDF